MKSLILFLVVFSFDSLAMSGKPKELQEIKIFGDYHPGGPKEIERSERFYREHGVLEEGQTLADSWQTAHMLEDLGKERFKIGKKSIIYCYGKILDEDRETAPMFDPNLRARMYDREGNLLAEDILKDRKSERKDPFLRLTVAYLPYLRNGNVTIRIVRLEGDEEVILYERDNDIYSHERLKRHDQSDLHGYGYAYRFYETPWTPERHWLPKVPCYM